MIDRAERRGQLVERGNEDVRGHDRLHAGLDRGAERLEAGADVVRRRRAARGASPLRSSPWPGEVLRAGGDALAPAARGRTRRRGGRRARRRRRTSGCRSPGSSGFDVHVGDGREVEVHADGGEVGADRGRDPLGQLRRRRRRRARRCPGTSCRGAASSRVTSPPSSSIPISTSGRASRSDAVSVAELLAVADVVGEEADPAEAVLEPAEHPVRRARAREARASDAAGGEPLELRSSAHRPGRQPERDPALDDEEEDRRPGSRSASRPPSGRPSRCRGSCRGSRRARSSASASAGRRAGCRRR